MKNNKLQKNKLNTKNEQIKVTKKISYEFSKKDGLTGNEKKFLKLVMIAGELVLKEDELLFKELAKY